jgi:hypothetical protein
MAENQMFEGLIYAWWRFFFEQNICMKKMMLRYQTAQRGAPQAFNCVVRLLTKGVTPDFPKKTKCISYVRQDQAYTHMIDAMSEISINNNKNVQELNHYNISLLHSNVRLEGLYNDPTITMKTQLHLHLPQAHDWRHASLRTPRSRWRTLL